MIWVFALGGRIQYTLAVTPREPTRSMCVLPGHTGGPLVIPWRNACVHYQGHTVSAPSRQSCGAGPAVCMQRQGQRACSHRLLHRLPSAPPSSPPHESQPPPSPPPHQSQPPHPQSTYRPAPASRCGHPTSASCAPAPNNPQTGGWCRRPARPPAPPAPPPCPTTQTQTAPQ